MIDLIVKKTINNIIIIIKILYVIGPNPDKILEVSKIKLQMALPNIPNNRDIIILTALLRNDVRNFFLLSKS